MGWLNCLFKKKSTEMISGAAIIKTAIAPGGKRLERGVKAAIRRAIQKAQEPKQRYKQKDVEADYLRKILKRRIEEGRKHDAESDEADT